MELQIDVLQSEDTHACQTYFLPRRLVLAECTYSAKVQLQHFCLVQSSVPNKCLFFKINQYLSTAFEHGLSKAHLFEIMLMFNRQLSGGWIMSAKKKCSLTEISTVSSVFYWL